MQVLTPPRGSGIAWLTGSQADWAHPGRLPGPSFGVGCGTPCGYLLGGCSRRCAHRSRRQRLSIPALSAFCWVRQKPAGTGIRNLPGSGGGWREPGPCRQSRRTQTRAPILPRPAPSSLSFPIPLIRSRAHPEGSVEEEGGAGREVGLEPARGGEGVRLEREVPSAAPLHRLLAVDTRG